jgi:hypothetical protein
MLARAVSSRPCSAVSFPLARAAFHTSNSRHTNAFFQGAQKEHFYLKGARAEVAKQPFEPGLIDKWGGYLPFLGGLTAIGLTKEILLIDAELLLAGCLTTVYVGIYIAVGDSLKKSLKGGMDKLQDFWNDVHDGAIAGVGFYKAEQKAKLDAGAVLRQYLDEYKDVMTIHAGAMALKPQHAAREKVLASLEAIRTRERLVAAGQWKKFVTAYENSLRMQLREPAIQDALFNASIRQLNDDSAEKEVDAILQKVLNDAMVATDDAVIPF